MARKHTGRDSGDIIANVIVHGLGVAALLCGLFVLWWGEDQTSRYSRLGGTARRSAVEMTDISRADPSLEGKLVHATGMAECSTPLEDPLFGVSLKAFTLKRDVRYYQLVEHETKKKDENGRIEVTYEYSPRWMRSPVPPGSFHSSYQRNRAKPPLKVLKSLSLTAEDVRLGAYRIPAFLAGSVQNARLVSPTLTEEGRAALLRDLHLAGDLLHETRTGFYIGRDPSTPHLGDVRIMFSARPITDVSILAQVSNGSFVRYHNPKDPQNVNIGQIMPGAVPLEDMVGKVDSDVTWGGWLVRGLSLLLAGLGTVFLPWDWMMESAPVRLLVNGSAADRKEWGVGAVFRLCLALMLLVAGATWLLNGGAAAGGTLLARSAVLFFLPCILPGKKKRKPSASA
jgi:hypothetical protein